MTNIERKLREMIPEERGMMYDVGTFRFKNYEDLIRGLVGWIKTDEEYKINPTYRICKSTEVVKFKMDVMRNDG